MKRIYTFLSAIVIAVTIFGQKAENELFHGRMLTHPENIKAVAIKIKYNKTMQKTCGTSISKSRLDSIVTLNLDGSLNSKKEFDDNGYLKFRINYKWNANSNKWVNDTKYEYNFNSKGKITLYISYKWNITNNLWAPNYKYEFIYNDNGNDKFDIYYSWDTVTGLWLYNFKDEYIWDVNGKNTLLTSYNWDSIISLWLTISKTEYVYDAGGKNILDNHFDWDTTKNIWMTNGKTEYVYDENENNTQYISYNWNVITSLWVISNKQENTYNEKGEITLEISQTWNNNTNLWEISDRNEYSYDTFGNRTGYIYYWNPTTTILTPYSKIEYLLDYTYLAKDVISGTTLNEFTNRPTSHKSFAYNGVGWYLSSTTTYFYSLHDYTADSPMLANPKTKVFYNTSDIIIEGTSEGESVSLFSINGKQIQTIQSQGERMVLPAQRDAVYLVKTGGRTFKVLL